MSERNQGNGQDMQGPPPPEQIDQVPSPSSGGEDVGQLRAIMEDLVSRVAALNRTVESRLRYDGVKEQAFERLYAELEDLKRDAAFEQVRPLLLDLILLHDRIDVIQQQVAQPGPAVSSIYDVLKTVTDELLEILSRREVELIHPADTAFNPSIQRAIGTQPTSEGSDNNQVGRVIRSGFSYRGRLLRAEEVIIKRYVPADVSSPADKARSERME